MDFVSRLIVALVLAVVSLGASAYGTVSMGSVQQSQYHYSYKWDGTSWFASRTAACSWYTGMADGGNTMMGYSGDPEQNGCVVKYCNDAALASGNCSASAGYGTTTVGALSTRSVAVNECPANATSDGSTCTCGSGFKPGTDGASCVAIGLCSTVVGALNVIGSVSSTGGVGSLTSCYGGCQLSSNFGGQGSDGSWFLYGPFTATGANCSGPGGTGSTVEPTTPEKIPPGKCPGTVNGLAVLVDCNRTTSQTTETAASSQTSASGATSSGPSTASTTTTTCEGGVCTSTTSTVVSNPDGSSSTTTGQKTDPQPPDSLCKANPSLTICKTSSVSGTCGAVACDGDAVQCAMVREQARRGCQLLDAASSTDPAVVAALGGSRPSDHPANSGVSVSLAGGFDKTNLIAGSCPADQVVQVSHFQPVTIPFSSLCGPAATLGNILVGLTALACIGIVFVRRG